jgi:hypothetical protein
VQEIYSGDVYFSEEGMKLNLPGPNGRDGY